MKLGKLTLAALLLLSGVLSAQSPDGGRAARVRMLNDPLWLVSGGQLALTRLVGAMLPGGAATQSLGPGCPSQVGGRVFFDLNSNGVYDSNETLLSGWKVRIRNLDTLQLKVRVTNAQGFYSAGGLPAGRYRITAVRPPPLSTTLANYGHTKVTLFPCLSVAADVPIPAWMTVPGPGHLPN